MRIIIYALGRIFERYREKLDWNQIVALADKKVKSIVDTYKIPTILPNEINSLEYDFIAVFSNDFFEEIKMELVGEYFIPQDKIISWREVIAEEGMPTAEILQFYRIFLKEKKCKKILDIGMSILSKNCLIKEEFLSDDELLLDGLWDGEKIQNDNLYDHIFKRYDECTEQYDAILLGGEQQRLKAEWYQMKQHVRFILMHTGYFQDGVFIKKNLETKLQQYGKVTCISNLNGLFWIIDTKKQKLSVDISVYVVTHKNYNVRSDCFYKPFCVGDYKKEGYLTEETGKNIAYLNPKINECTALYWIWKNTNTKYVGLNHYRRYFYANEIRSMDNYLDVEYASEILEEYDIILPKPHPVNKTKVLEEIRNSINQELCEKAYILFRSKIIEKQPNYVQAFDSVMEGNSAFLCNMFVTKREILERYCEWLFSFLLEVAEEMDVEGYDNYSQRVTGFFAERMWTVWLRKNRLRIKELPYVIVK